MPVPFFMALDDRTSAVRTEGRLLLVDGHAYAYRAFFAIRELSSPTGAPTNAIFGFVKALNRLRDELKPTHEAVIWDGGLASERLELLPAYKAERPPMPPALAAQLDDLAAWVEASGGTSQVRDGVEADDWIAAWAWQASEMAMEVVIASSDKDFMQLVSPRVSLVNPNDKVARLWTADDVKAKTGVGPEAVVDWLSLVGDSVDNIAGVPGVGPKTAAALLSQFGDWERLKAGLASVASDRIRAALSAAVGIVERNRELIRLRSPAGLPSVGPALERRPPDVERLRSLYATWGFRTLGAQLPAATPAQGELGL